MWVESEPEYALLEEVWGVRSNPDPPIHTVHKVAPPHKAYAEPVKTPSPTSIVPSQEKKMVETVHPTSQPMERKSANTPPCTTVNISDPVLNEYFSMYKDEFRDRIVESILLRHLRETEEYMYGTNSLQKRIKILFSDPSGNNTLLLIAWFAIALCLFLLLIRGPKT